MADMMRTEDKIMAVVNRFLELKKESQKKLKEIEIMKEVAGFSIVELGDIDEPTIYSHKSHKGIIFYDDEMQGDNIRPFKRIKGEMNDKEIKNNTELNKLCKFLNEYTNYAQIIWLNILIDEKDYLVGEYISRSEWEEVTISIDIEHHYRISIPIWAKRKEEISVYYLMKQPQYEKDFWKNYKENQEQQKKIDAMRSKKA